MLCSNVANYHATIEGMPRYFQFCRGCPVKFFNFERLNILGLKDYVIQRVV